MKVTELPIGEVLGNPLMMVLGYIVVGLLVVGVTGGLVLMGLRGINKK